MSRPNPPQFEEENRLQVMTSLPPISSPHSSKPMSLQRRLRRVSVRMRTSPFSVPLLLTLGYAGIMLGLTQVADSWIVALAITPLVFALLISLGCLLAYMRDFYA